MKLSAEQKAANKLARQQAKAEAKKLAQIQADKNQKPVDLITISIEWSKAGNPTCTAKIYYKDATAQQITARAGGWGYCKESTVIANIFNASLKYKLYQITDADKKPYGINLYNDRFYFAGGVGTSCYYNIAEFIGGKFERVASGKTYDAFRFTFNN